MWLSKTTFGHHLLKGRIPGSSEAVRQDVNANCITIQHIANNPILPILNDYQQVNTNNVLDIVREENSYDALGVSMVESDGNEKLLPLNSNSIVHNKANSIFTVREHKPNKFNLRKESFKIPQLIAAITLMLCLVTILSKIVTTNLFDKGILPLNLFKVLLNGHFVYSIFYVLSAFDKIRAGFSVESHFSCIPEICKYHCRGRSSVGRIFICQSCQA